MDDADEHEHARTERPWSHQGGGAAGRTAAAIDVAAALVVDRTLLVWHGRKPA